MIKDRSEMPERLEIDLTGPQGNAFALLGYTRNLGKQIGKTKEELDDIHSRMTSGDYDNLVEVFDEEFGEFITLYR